MRIKPIVSLAGAMALAVSSVLASAGAATANTPRWSMTVTNLPPVVGSGSPMAYQVTISNAGPSNISHLYLVTETKASPAYVATSQGTCAGPGSGPLACTFGALRAKKSVTVTVAYTAPFTDTDDPGDPVFQGNSNGLTYSDGGTSHGDTLTDPNEKGTVISTDTDFNAEYALSDLPLSTNDALSNANRQSTSVQPPATNIVVSAQDGPSVSFSCKKICSKAFGEWSAINVADGQKFSTFFPVTLLMRASDAPNNLSQIKLAHVLDNGTTVQLNQCTTTRQNCIVVTPVGQNVKITAYLDQNGGIRGIR